MANREGTALSDEQMRIHCFEGKAPPLGRLDLLLPPPQNTSKVFYKDPKRNARMERPISVAAQMENLSKISKTPTDTLFSAYNETRKNKKDPSMKLAQRTYRYNPTTMYVPDITDEIFAELLNAQVYEAPTFTQDYPPVGAEDIFGLIPPRPVGPEMTQRERQQAEVERQQKESAESTRPASVTLAGRGRPPTMTIDPPPTIPSMPQSEAESIFRAMGQ